MRQVIGVQTNPHKNSVSIVGKWRDDITGQETFITEMEVPLQAAIEIANMLYKAVETLNSSQTGDR